MAIRTSDSFVRITCVGIVAWIVGQALINLGAVLQLLPITGVPLPFVSYGGSSLLPSLMAIGVLLAFARQEAVRAGRPRAGSTRRRPWRSEACTSSWPEAGPRATSSPP